MKQSVEEAIKNPSEAAVATQVEKAAKAWQELEPEESLIPHMSFSRSHRSSNPTGSGGRGSSRQPAPKTRPKASAKSKVQPIIYAAKQRAKTAKDFADVERALTKSKEVAQKVLVDVAPKLLGDTVTVESDSSLQLLRSRLEMVTLAQDQQTGKAAIDLGKELYTKAMEDPYLKDLSVTLFTDPSSVQTIGALSHVRRVTLDLPLNALNLLVYSFCLQHSSDSSALDFLFNFVKQPISVWFVSIT